MSYLHKPLHTPDGRELIFNSQYGGNLNPYFAGCADTEETIGGGAGFILAWTSIPPSAEQQELVFSFRDWVDLSGGDLRWKGGNPGDEATLKLRAPATAVTVNGSNEGNCNLAPTGQGQNFIIPAAGDGTHDVAEGDMVPVPTSVGGEYYWEWDTPATGKGKVTEPSFTGKGNCNLFDGAIPMVTWVGRLQLVGSGQKELKPQTTTRRIYPHWELVVSAWNAGASDSLVVTWDLDMARKTT